MSRAGVEVFADSDALADAAAGVVAAAGAAAVTARGRFTLALSGGSTPQALYQRLAIRTDIDWRHVHVVWGDERCVAPTDATSNYRLARQALLDHVAIPAAQVHRMHGEASPAVEARRYEAILRTLVPDGVLDLVLLGLGTDGHTASLFPGDAAGREDAHWVVDASFDDSRGRRLTLTPPLLTAARALVFLVAGDDKAAALAAVLDGPSDPDRLPAQRIARAGASVRWLVDAPAALPL